jgi:hypothetical protein
MRAISNSRHLPTGILLQFVSSLSVVSCVYGFMFVFFTCGISKTTPSGDTGVIPRQPSQGIRIHFRLIFLAAALFFC